MASRVSGDGRVSSYWMAQSPEEQACKERVRGLATNGITPAVRVLLQNWAQKDLKLLSAAIDVLVFEKMIPRTEVKKAIENVTWQDDYHWKSTVATTLSGL